MSVWNKNHAQMPNGFGLFGNASSSQSALIIPKPGDCEIYYIFTVPDFTHDSAFCYSVVDMSLDGGLGNIISKNIPLLNSVSEKLTGILKSNGTDYWVIVKDQANAFMAYSVTAAGVNTNPVISYAGIAPAASDDFLGYMRLSPDGTKLCMVYDNSYICQLFDFDISTGMVTNPIVLPITVNDYPYGVEFSPDNNRLYISGNTLFQFNLLAGSPSAIQNSRIVIPTSTTNQALKLGPDNRIYISNFNLHSISVIDQPNELGLACNYVPHFLNLGSAYCQAGLPNNINNYSNCLACPISQNISSAVEICSNATYQLPSGTIVNTAGIYIDTLRNLAGCDSIITNTSLFIFPVSFLNSEAHICSNETYQLPSGTIAHNTGIYLDTLRSSSYCDSIINTIHLFVNDVSNTNIVDSIFDGQVYTLPSGVMVSSADVYQSVLLNNVGCDSVITTTLRLRKEISECLIMKNAITPNGDGINDHWVLYKYNCFKRLEVNVYNRYGSLLYHSDDYKNDWNGKYKNKELPDGTYYYVMKVISYGDREHLFKGNITLLR
ncbi:MAG: gliding motility-associated C-terminal domain-containing protein [Ferruginibacter sp.]